MPERAYPYCIHLVYHDDDDKPSISGSVDRPIIFVDGEMQATRVVTDLGVVHRRPKGTGDVNLLMKFDAAVF